MKEDYKKEHANEATEAVEPSPVQKIKKKTKHFEKSINEFQSVLNVDLSPEARKKLEDIMSEAYLDGQIKATIRTAVAIVVAVRVGLEVINGIYHESDNNNLSPQKSEPLIIPETISGNK